MLLWLLACPAPFQDSAVLDPAAVNPTITSAAVSCEAAAARWALVVETDAWTGGGSLWLSDDGTYVEQHDFGSYEAAIDGSADRLKLTLAVAESFQEVRAGSSTWFNCGHPALQGLLVVRSRDGAAVTDCRSFGDAPSSWSAWAIGDCADTVEVSALP